MKSQQISSEMTIKLTGNRAAKAVASSYGDLVSSFFSDGKYLQEKIKKQIVLYLGISTCTS
jgi:hypothetical protein